MRRFIPHAILAMMTVLAVVALVLSLGSAQKISYFSTLPAGNPSIVSIFRTVVQRSLDAPSFNFNGYIDYQAPDRTRTSGLYADEVIGDELYLTTFSLSNKWGRTDLTPFEDRNEGPEFVKLMLNQLLTSDSVVRTGDNFVVTSIVPASNFVSFDPGQVEVIKTVYVSDDYVDSIAMRVEGWISVPVSRPTGGYSLRRVSHVNIGSYSYGDYGYVKPIVAPPSSDVVPLVSCSSSSAGAHVYGADLVNICLPRS